MVKVSIGDFALAQTDNVQSLEGNQYFPYGSFRNDVLSPSKTTYVCPWKGNAFYYNATVNGQVLHDVAWFYPHPKDAAKQIAGCLAFDKKQVKFED